MKCVLTHLRGKAGRTFIDRRECTRLIKYKGLYFGACPNRIDGARPYSYDILEISTGLKVKEVPRLKDGYPCIRDLFYPIIKQLKTSYISGTIREMSEYVAENGEDGLIVDMQEVFKSLREMGIIENLLI